uniref:G-protein coupled receptors family 1 profile domain-containing protein n=1 Tax=Ditylenchus dipsaci TaxID=166011 RepID=A0A915CR13_9BILA
MDNIYKVNTVICLILGITLNSILTCLILKVSDKKKRKPGKILLLTCGIDVISLLTFAIIQPVFYTELGNILVIQMGHFKKSSPIIVVMGISVW